MLCSEAFSQEVWLMGRGFYQKGHSGGNVGRTGQFGPIFRSWVLNPVPAWAAAVRISACFRLSQQEMDTYRSPQL